MKNEITLAITGHRDIVETQELRRDVSNYLEQTIKNNLNHQIVLLSPLADGADRLVAELFLEQQQKYNNLSLIVPMPFDQERYMHDFDELSKKDFLMFLEKSDAVFEVEHTTTNEYLDVGRYVVESADVLLALWDGTYNGKIGGTGEVVEYAKANGHEVVHFVCDREKG